jgi:hypothetical protein
MSIVRIIGSAEYNAGVMPSWVSIETSDPIATVMATGYLNGTNETWGINYSNAMMALVTASDLTTPLWLAINIDAQSNINLISASNI